MTLLLVSYIIASLDIVIKSSCKPLHKPNACARMTLIALDCRTPRRLIFLPVAGFESAWFGILRFSQSMISRPGAAWSLPRLAPVYCLTTSLLSVCDSRPAPFVLPNSARCTNEPTTESKSVCGIPGSARPGQAHRPGSSQGAANAQPGIKIPTSAILQRSRRPKANAPP